MNLYSLAPKTYNRVFSEKTYKKIYDAVNSILPTDLTSDVPSESEYMNVPDLGYFAVPVSEYKFGKEVFDEVKTATEGLLGINVEKPEIHFARYTKKTGSDPILRPHYDEMLKYPSVTMSIQLETTIPWAIGAYNVTETLNANDGILFSGSHQVHWRPRTEFSDSDYFDIMVCQMVISDEKLTDNHLEFMRVRVNEYAADFWEK